ncbi:MAG: phosphoribosylformylglycinamidine cyclo-ligase [Deltaproteobacteria bacterium]|nr:MAG: phosphoribosylformylglycinamidine cyclo-ligase [Deltaproteobacteria bacterium]
MMTYKQAGVDIDAGNAFVKMLKPIIEKTLTTGAKKDFGGFAGGFELPSEFGEGVLFGATDGVGTKLKVAIEAQKLDTIGIDLVAMSVNDLICSFAKPLFFLDYYACEHLDTQKALEVVSGIAKGCEIAHCALIGGESAEMPGLYAKNDFDIAGFSVGIAHKKDLKKCVNVGDAIIGLASSGLHSNGFSLARAVFERLGISLKEHLFNEPLWQTLLTPTKIYVDEFLHIQHLVSAIAHITGGGIKENLARSLQGKGALLQKSAIPKQEIFEFLSKHIDESELWRTFNMGVGLICICPKDKASEVLRLTDGFIFGEVTNGDIVLG